MVGIFHAFSNSGRAQLQSIQAKTILDRLGKMRHKRPSETPYQTWKKPPDAAPLFSMGGKVNDLPGYRESIFFAGG